jgi:phage terminase large subunit-like protein
VSSLNNALQQYQDLIAFVKERMEDPDFWDWLNELDEETRDDVVSVMGDPAFTLNAHQIMPDSDAQTEHGERWRIWFLRMGRGAGKTYGAACNVNLLARYLYPGQEGIIIGPTVKHVRETMIDGLLKSAQPDFVPRFEPSASRIVWPNGSKAVIYTADNPEAIRGPTVYWGWGDELTLWTEGTFDNMTRAVRNRHPHGNRLILGTSPISAQTWVKAIERRPSTITSIGTSLDNPDGLDEALLRELEREAATGSRKAREEILGEWIEGSDKLWTKQDLDLISLSSQALSLEDMCAQMDSLQLDIDPGGKRDLTGLILLGKQGETHWVLGDFSEGGSNQKWQARVVEIVDKYMKSGGRIVVETNRNNGVDDDLRTLLRGRNIHVEGKHQPPGQGKIVRAERAQQLYERDLVRHFRVFPELHLQMDEFYEVVADKNRSPDRVDALCMGLNWYMDSKPARLSIWQMPFKARFAH